MNDPHLVTPSGRPRARGIGIPLDGIAGPVNAITDVAGVEVGYVTLVSGEGPLRRGHGPVRTGVTALLPRGRAGIGVSCAAGWHSFNGNGELTGSHWLAETGSLSSAVLLTNTFAVGPCHRGAVDWINARQPDVLQWDFPVVGETYDGHLNDVDGSHVQPEHAVRAIDDARGGPVDEGSVGGGTGMVCYGFKGGSGTASRVVHYGDTAYTVGAFVQANFGARRELVVAGRPVGRLLIDDNPVEGVDRSLPPGAGSVIAVVATDAPLLPHQCSTLARRVTLGIGRTGTSGSHHSGDIFLAFSTANPGVLASTPGARDEAPSAPHVSRMEFLAWNTIDPLFEATVQAVEEAVLNALIANEAMVGRDNHRVPALPHDQLRDLFSS
ncbi:DmpA family aminopeptidase [Kutzneria sp. CA-103260]|uniref:DmpA family aminopeptidase n=1 Tax=Kutzneria sp. CA-103260 TaxID=2802641 RepID=UPI001BACB515|nr:P1 family peptidase [Kutzneria sp. CA-103260]QUQ72505.1 D-aminopeptidase [Kutzneria sp. CA-103260]